MLTDGRAEDVRALPKIVIVGAGFGGLGCARELVALGCAGARADVTLVADGDAVSLGAAWQYVWTNRCELAATRWPRAQC